jgi:hypothetical protein
MVSFYDEVMRWISKGKQQPNTTRRRNFEEMEGEQRVEVGTSIWKKIDADICMGKVINYDNIEDRCFPSTLTHQLFCLK